LKTGERRWRVQRNPKFNEMPGNKWKSEIARRKIVYHVVMACGDRVYLLFACDANGGGPSLVVCYDGRTGKELWYTHTRPQYDPSAEKISGGGEMFNLFGLDDGTLFAIGHQWARLDQETGELLACGHLGGNARCDSHSCTVDLVTAGFGNYFDLASPELRWTRRDLARGQCGGRSTPAYGMTYHQSSGCKCFFPIRGQMALHRTRQPEPLPADQRRLAGPAADRPLGPAAAEGDWPRYLYDDGRRAWAEADGPQELTELWRARVAEPLPPDARGLRADWLQTSLYNGPATAPVIAGGLVFVADRDRHRVVALDATTGAERWSRRVRGRVVTPPSFARGRLVLGTRAGWVYCLDAATGEVAWRFLAAPEERYLVAYGQVESAWPLHGCLPVADGVAVATAGYHGEADGGVWAWGLDLASGAVRWQRRLHRPERPWKTYGPPDRRGFRRIRDSEHPVGYVNRSNGGYCVTSVRNVDIPARNGAAVRAARVLLDAATGQVVATPRALTQRERDKRPEAPAFIIYTERFPHLDMEFEGPGGPHGPGSWTWGALGHYRSGIRRLAHNGQAVIMARLHHPAPELHYLPSPSRWERGYFRDAQPIATLEGRTDSLVVGGTTAYAAGEGTNEMPWGRNNTRPRHRIAKGEPVPGHLQAVRLPDGEVLASVQSDAAVINNGLAVAAGRLYAVCEDGTVRCFGSKP
ncbi:MAG: PQQ-binding-like beta-propeller repeat protein, partial [Planctomycetota bacterium]